MNFLALLDRYAPGRRLPCLAAAAIGGLLAALVVSVVNEATAADTLLASWSLGLAFLVVLAVMYVSQRIAVRYLVTAFEDVQRGLRDELGDRLRTAGLRSIEQLEGRLGQASGELAYIAGEIDHWVGGVQHMAFLVCVTAVVATISFKAWVIWMVALGVSTAFLWPRLRRMNAVGRSLGAQTGALSEWLEQLLDGFVQVKLDGRVAAGITDDVVRSAEELYRAQSSLRQLGVTSIAGAILLVYLLSWGPAAFADPAGIGLGPVEGYEMITLVELSLGPLFGLLNALPEWSRVEAAARGVVETLDGLEPEPAAELAANRAPAPAAAELRTIALQGARFTYTEDGAGFTVGPIDLTIRRGDLVLLTGGNGSGKTTLMKMLLGLYPLEGGRVAVDDRGLSDAELAAHRGRFTAIFTHQHLFSRLYGLEDAVSQAQVDALLERFGIAEIVKYRDGGFDRVDLSTGQKMRLAMVVALLEDRPVCVFDEWTANQDPETTWFYYETLLPELVAAGKTVIAVSHDDRFFDRADHFIAMADGRVVEERRRGG
jgi:putative pyoverdin transport system ATP-binding/permease protein